MIFGHWCRELGLRVACVEGRTVVANLLVQASCGDGCLAEYEVSGVEVREEDR